MTESVMGEEGLPALDTNGDRPASPGLRPALQTALISERQVPYKQNVTLYSTTGGILTWLVSVPEHTVVMESPATTAAQV